MIRNNLAALLAERSIRITTAAMETKISRNTITSTAQNDGKMIQLETINTLCRYLNITPAEFFSYLPYDIEFSIEPNDFTIHDGKLSHPVFDAILVKEENGIRKSFDLSVILTGKELATYYFNDVQEFRINVLLGSYDTLIGGVKLSEEQIEDFNNMWNAIPAGFQSDIKEQIETKTLAAFKDEYAKKVPDDFHSNIRYFVNSNWFISSPNFDASMDDSRVNTSVKYDNGLPF